MVVDRSAIKRSDRGANYDDSSTPARQEVIHPGREEAVEPDEQFAAGRKNELVLAAADGGDRFSRDDSGGHCTG